MENHRFSAFLHNKMKKNAKMAFFHKIIWKITISALFRLINVSILIFHSTLVIHYDHPTFYGLKSKLILTILTILEVEISQFRFHI
jgi:hypothetical protein